MFATWEPDFINLIGYCFLQIKNKKNNVSTCTYSLLHNFTSVMYVKVAFIDTCASLSGGSSSDGWSRWSDNATVVLIRPEVSESLAPVDQWQPIAASVVIPLTHVVHHCGPAGLPLHSCSGNWLSILSCLASLLPNQPWRKETGKMHSFNFMYFPIYYRLSNSGNIDMKVESSESIYIS